jgi:hypothetical protein
MIPEEKAAVDALRFVIPLLESMKVRWVITGGFACYVYGVKRKLTDIDIDIDISKDNPGFATFVKSVEPYITQPLMHYVSDSYDNYNLEATVSGQILDICTMPELKMFDKATATYQTFYKNGFPNIENADFHGIALPLLSKDLIILNKEAIMRDEWDARDIEGLRTLI